MERTMIVIHHNDQTMLIANLLHLNHQQHIDKDKDVANDKII